LVQELGKGPPWQRLAVVVHGLTVVFTPKLAIVLYFAIAVFLFVSFHTVSREVLRGRSN
jgi:hypothetical protein